MALKEMIESGQHKTGENTGKESNVSQFVFWAKLFEYIRTEGLNHKNHITNESNKMGPNISALIMDVKHRLNTTEDRLIGRTIAIDYVWIVVIPNREGKPRY